MKLLSKLSRENNLLRGLLFSLFSFLNKGIAFILLLILAKYITPDEYGYLSLYSSLVVLFGYFIGLSTPGYISVVFFQKSKHEFAKDFTSIIAIIVASIIVLIFIITLIPSNFFLSNLSLSKDIIYYSVLVSALGVFFTLYLDYVRVNEQVLRYGIFSCGYAIITFILSIVFIVVIQKGWQGKVYAEFASYALFVIFAIVFIIKNRLIRFRHSITKERLCEILIWGLPLIPHLASTWIRQGLDRFIINSSYDIYTVGIFSFALNLVNIINILGLAFNSSNSVDLFKVLSDNSSQSQKYSKINRLLKQTGGIYIIATVLIVLIVLPLVYFFLPKYILALKFFLPLSIFGLLQCVYYLFCNFLFYYKKNFILMLITFTSSLIHLLLSLIFTKISLFCTVGIYIITQSIVVFSVYKVAMKSFFESR